MEIWVGPSSAGTEKGEKCLEDERRGVKEAAEAMMAVRQSSSCRFLGVAVQDLKNAIG